MGGLWRAKDTIYLVLAVLFFITFALGVVVGVSYYVGYPRCDPGFLPIITATCVPTALVPGVIFLYLGRRARESEKSLVEFAAWVKSFRKRWDKNSSSRSALGAMETCNGDSSWERPSAVRIASR